MHSSLNTVALSCCRICALVLNLGGLVREVTIPLEHFAIAMVCRLCITLSNVC